MRSLSRKRLYSTFWVSQNALGEKKVQYFSLIWSEIKWKNFQIVLKVFEVSSSGFDPVTPFLKYGPGHLYGCEAKYYWDLLFRIIAKALYGKMGSLVVNH